MDFNAEILDRMAHNLRRLQDKKKRNCAPWNEDKGAIWKPKKRRPFYNIWALAFEPVDLCCGGAIIEPKEAFRHMLNNHRGMSKMFRIHVKCMPECAMVQLFTMELKLCF